MSKRKTHEEYVVELSAINPNIEIVEKYVDAKTKILHRCLLDDYKWLVCPNKTLQGKGCPKCAKNNKKTHDEYVYELSSKNPSLKVIEEYKGCKIAIIHKCLIHNIFWKISPSSALKGSGCSECLKEKISKKNKMSHENYVNEVKNINPNIVVLGEYINGNTTLLHKCLVHNIEWYTSPRSILNGSGCYKCGINKLKEQKTKTNEDYLAELKYINPNIIAIEEYKDSNTSILHRCLIDGYEWFLKPGNALSGRGCPKCGGNLKKTSSEYEKELSTVNPDIKVIDSYLGANIPILHQCLIDNYKWKARPVDILRGRCCPKCSESKGERQVRLWLEKHDISYEKQYKFEDCRDNKPLPFDFYLPTYNRAIEYDGKQHFEPIEFFGGQESFEICQKHDKIKNEYCKNNGISLLRIPYYKNTEEELNNFLFI